MANYWAIVIGINQYQYFQPLNCAQADAEALKNSLVTQAGYQPDNCLLMTDTSPPVGERVTSPTRENILIWLEELAGMRWQPEDRVWFFFNGYGINHKGQDYLMPIEGNPERVEETGIEVGSLLQSLRLAVDHVLVFLDMNRPASSPINSFLGVDTLEAAQEMQIPLVLSSQPDQFSRESTDIGHGFFTASLLEALHIGRGRSMSELLGYVCERTPELCQNHERPIQNPIIVLPYEEQALDAILPPSWREGNEENNTGENGIDPMLIFAQALEAPSLEPSPSPVAPRGELIADREQRTEIPATAGQGQKVTPRRRTSQASQTPSLFRQLLLWGASTLAVCGLIVAVMYRNRGFLRLPDLTTASSENVLNKERGKSQKNPTLTQTPNNQTPQSTVPVISDPKQRNQAILQEARTSLLTTQASKLQMAIATARKVQPGEPLYDQAQEDIKRWTRMIFDLAEGRAKQRQYKDAIAAVNLIDKKDPLHAQAQEAVKRWKVEDKQLATNKTLLEAASGLIKTGQASSLNRAIEVARQVPPGQPGSELAQQYINDWSGQILALAKYRGESGNIEAAIATATLVPEDTSVYESAQQAIKEWKQK